MNRNISLDLIRTTAIILMVVFHFIYDLKFFGFIDWDTPDGDGWRHFRWVIISLFFLCLGVSLTFAHERRFKGKKFALRTLQIAFAAMCISVVTFFAIPENWIFFGVLHFLALSSLIVVWFVRFPKLSFLLGISIIIFGATQALPARWPFNEIFNNLPRYTNDYVALQPWLGVVFLGIPLAHWTRFRNDPMLFQFSRLSPGWQTGLVWPGQHSLSIYLLHQPILMGILYLVTIAV